MSSMSAPIARDRARRRRVPRAVVHVIAACVVVAAGLGLREFAAGPVAKYGGVALYAVLVYVLVSAARPGRAPRIVLFLTVVICTGVELLQLTPIPARLAGEHRGFALVLGTTFHGWDLLAYAGGALAAAGVHWVTRRGYEAAANARVA